MRKKIPAKLYTLAVSLETKKLYKANQTHNFHNTSLTSRELREKTGAVATAYQIFSLTCQINR